MKAKGLLRIALVSSMLVGICAHEAFAKTTIKMKQYSIGFYLDDSDCDFGERYELPESFPARITIKTVTRYVRGRKVVTNYIYRYGQFPFKTTLNKLKLRKRGFTASGTRDWASRSYIETITVSTSDGLATNTMKIFNEGFPCRYSYSGDASLVK